MSVCIRYHTLGHEGELIKNVWAAVSRSKMLLSTPIPMLTSAGDPCHWYLNFKCSVVWICTCLWAYAVRPSWVGKESNSQWILAHSDHQAVCHSKYARTWYISSCRRSTSSAHCSALAHMQHHSICRAEKYISCHLEDTHIRYLPSCGLLSPSSPETPTTFHIHDKSMYPSPFFFLSASFCLFDFFFCWLGSMSCKGHTSSSLRGSNHAIQPTSPNLGTNLASVFLAFQYVALAASTLF